MTQVAAPHASHRLIWPPFQEALSAGAPGISTVGPDAVNEAMYLIGHVHLAAGSGSKTFGTSSKIYTIVQSSVINDVATNLRIGVQNVSAASNPVVGNGTFRVYHDQTSAGTDPVNLWTAAMSATAAGAITITQGDLIAVVAQFTAFGGIDTIVFRNTSSGYAAPRPTVTQALPTAASTTTTPVVVLEFDDGTFGTLDGAFITSNTSLSATRSFKSDTATADEYGNIVQVPFPCKADAVTGLLQVTTSAADFSVLLYEFPTGIANAPSLLAGGTIVVDAMQLNNLNVMRPFLFTFAAPISLAKDTPYYVSIQPTTITAVVMLENTVNATGWWNLLGGPNSYKATRLDNTGVVTTSVLARMCIGVRIASLDDAVGGAAGMQYRNVMRGNVA